jgi:hypothetical protein
VPQRAYSLNVAIDIADLEGEAQALYRAGGFSMAAPAPSVGLARRLLGDEAVRVAPAQLLLDGNGALVRVGSDWRIYIRGSAPPRAKRFALLHELAHWALGAEATEVECDALAAALLVPRQAFLLALGGLGERLPRLAQHFNTTESCIALRHGEATDAPMVLVTPYTVRARGAEWSWPTETKLRAWARRPGPGLRKARLRDEPERVVLRVIAD